MTYDTAFVNKTTSPTRYANEPRPERPPTDLSLSEAIGDLREVAAEAAKACEDYLVARDRWVDVRDRLIDIQSKVSALRDQWDATR